MAFERAVPVLQVRDVEATADWYATVLGFATDPFPEAPPYSFAIMRRDGAELMLQAAEGAGHGGAPPPGDFEWSVYLRVAGTGVLQVAAAVGQHSPILRGPEKMFYGLVEFEVADPDGHRICVSGMAPADAIVPDFVADGDP